MYNMLELFFAIKEKQTEKIKNTEKLLIKELTTNMHLSFKDAFHTDGLDDVATTV